MYKYHENGNKNIFPILFPYKFLQYASFRDNEVYEDLIDRYSTIERNANFILINIEYRYIYIYIHIHIYIHTYIYTYIYTNMLIHCDN